MARVFSDRVFAMSLSRTRDREAAQELCQETLLAVLCALRNGQVRQPENLPGFVHGTARNLINNFLRARAQHREQPLDFEFPAARYDESVEMAERMRIVHGALDRLEVLDRKVLLLTLVDGLKPGEISRRLGLNSDMVRQRKSRAQKKVIEMVKILSRTGAHEPPQDSAQ